MDIKKEFLKVVHKPTYLKKGVLVHFVGRLWGHRNYRKFVVVTRSRTGSTMLINMLKSHPSIYAKGEIFRTLNGQQIDDVLDQIFFPMPRRIKAVGFKIFYYHPEDDESGLTWQKLKLIDDLLVIHLKRRNVLRTLTSRKIVGNTNVWRQHRWDRKNPRLPDKVIQFSPEELFQGFEQTRRWEARCEEIFESHRMLDVIYENLVRSPKREFERITTFLGVGSSTYYVNIKKQNPEKLSRLIANYDSLRETFRNTEWSCYFEDEHP